MTRINKEDLAYGIVEDYLLDGPEYSAIVEAAVDNGFETEGDLSDISAEIDDLLSRLRKYL